MTQVQPDPLPSRPSRKRRVLKWGMRIVIALIVLGIAAWAIANYWAARTIRQEITRIRAAGQPVTFDELDALTPRAQAADDAAPFYAAALALARPLDDKVDDAYRKAIKTGILDAADLAEGKRLLEENRLALEMLDRATTRPGCNFDLDLRFGIAASLPRLNSVRGLANAASFRTRSLALTGQGEEAIQSAIASLRLLRILDRQPVLVAYLVRIGCNALACRDIQVILEHCRPTSEALMALDTALAEVEQSADFQRVCLAERVYYLEVVRNTLAGGRELRPTSANPVALPESVQWPASLATRLMVAQTLPAYSRFADASAKGFPQAIDAMSAQTMPSSIFDFWGKIIGPSLHRSTLIAGRITAQNRTTRVAIRAEQYRLAHGRLPVTLAELALPEPAGTDPFTGQPLLYRTLPSGFVVYSLGEDRHDDGGGDEQLAKFTDVGLSIRIPAP